MRITETKTETREFKTTVAIRCDKCGKHSPRPDSWADNGFGQHSYRLEGEDIESYPEGAWGTRVRIDLCPACWREVLDYLRDRGMEIEEEEIDW